eukprot:m.3498 g.3498  ORF g.3498 m.3498 type:complete len:1143 (-) comp2079_c0_seq1:138-3566(-)
MDEINLISFVIEKGDNGFGLTIHSEGGVHRIVDIKPDGSASSSGLKPNDQIIKINEHDTPPLEHHEIIELLQVATNATTFVVCRGEDESDSMDSTSQTSTEEQVASSSLTLEEVKAFKPFENIDECLAHPAHCALFLSFLLQPQGMTEDEMLLLLNLRWMMKHPTIKAARSIYHDFLAVIAPMRVDCVSDHVLDVVEKILSSKHTRKADIVNALNPVLTAIHKHVSIVLHDFNHILRHEPSQIQNSNSLVNLSQGEELHTAELLLVPHLHAAQDALKQEEHDHVSARYGIIEQSILQFLEQLGSSGKLRTRTKSSIKRTSRVNQKIHFVNGHQFVTTTYTHFTYCAVCKSLIYGLARQGWDCLLCGMHVHKEKDRFSASFQQCHKSVKKCTGFKEEKKSLFGSTRRRFQRKSSHIPNRTGTLTVHKPEDLTSSFHGSVSKLSLNESTVSNVDSSSIKSTRSVQNTNELPYASIDVEPEFWQSTVPDAVMKSLSDKEKKRQELIFELIQTEKKFVRDLFIFRELFRTPLIQKKYLSSSVVHGLFGRIDALWENNAPIARQLETLRVMNESHPVLECGASIVKLFREFDMESYAQFCSGQQRALKYYEQQMMSNPRFADVIQLIEAQPIVKRLTFRDFVAKPLQRLTKYPLLFKGILKYTADSNKQEKKDLQELLSLSQGVLNHVQSCVQSKEDTRRLNDIDDQMDRSHLNITDKYFLKNIVENGFQLVQEGNLKLKCNGKFVEVHVILLTHVLILCQVKDERLVVKIPVPKEHRRPVITVDQLYVRTVATEKKGFFVISGKKTAPEIYEFRTSTSQLRTTWMESIEATSKSFNVHYPNWIESVQQKLEEEQAKAEEEANQQEEDEGSDEEIDEYDLDMDTYVHYQLDKLQELLSQIEDIRERMEERLEAEGFAHLCVNVEDDLDSNLSNTIIDTPTAVNEAKSSSEYRSSSPNLLQRVIERDEKNRRASNPFDGFPKAISRKKNMVRTHSESDSVEQGVPNLPPSPSPSAHNLSKEFSPQTSPVMARSKIPPSLLDVSISNDTGEQDVPHGEKKELYYVTQYAYALERIAQLNGQVIKLESSHALSQMNNLGSTWDMHEPSYLPPDAPMSDAPRRRDSSVSSTGKRSLIMHPPVNEVSHESFI